MTRFKIVSDIDSDKVEKMIEIRCPNKIVDHDDKVWTCNALLCKMTPSSAINIRCRKCKALWTIVIGQKDGQPKFQKEED